MRILLINPPGWQEGSVSLGLGYLGSVLKRDGHEVKVLDFTGQTLDLELIQKKTLAFAPHLVGFHTKTAQAKNSSRISEAIKKVYPHAIHVVGGPHVTLCYEEYLNENPGFEYGFQGEADINFSEFVKRVESGAPVEDIPGIVYRKDGNIVALDRQLILALDELPRPDFDLIENFNWKDFRYPLLTSRGCPYKCSFCSVPIISSKRFRTRTPEDCVDELAAVKREKGIDCFEILDDNLTLDMNRAKEFCRALIKADLKLSWYCHNGIRADRLDQELADLMYQAGCTSIAFGVESGDQEVFRRVVKGEDLEHIVHAIEMTKKAGMKTVGYFIIGLPGDNLKAVKRTIQFQKTLQLDHFVYGVFIPYPGTRGRDLVLKEGRIIRDIKDTNHFSDRPQISIEYPYFTRDEIEEAYYIATAGELSELIQQWGIKGPLEQKVLYVESDPPRHGYRRFAKFIPRGVDLLVSAAFDGCFEYDKEQKFVSEVTTYRFASKRIQIMRELIGHFWRFGRQNYFLAMFPFNRRKSILLAFLALVRARHTVLYDFDGSRFVEVSLSNPVFRRFLKIYLKRKLFGEGPVPAQVRWLTLPARLLVAFARIAYRLVAGMATTVSARIDYFIVCRTLRAGELGGSPSSDQP